MFIWQWAVTEPYYHAHDLEGHVAYVRYIAENYAIPRPDGGWLFYHPPLYYLLAAVAYKLGGVMGGDAIQSARFVSIPSFVIFLLFSMFMLRRMRLPVMPYYFALMLLLFWPNNLRTAVRLDGNTLFYAFYAGALYFLLVWWQDLRTRSLVWALVFASLALMTRGTGYLLLIELAVIVLCRYFFSRRRPDWHDLHTLGMAWALIFLLVGVAVHGGRNVYLRVVEQKQQGWLVGNQTEIPGQFGNFLPLDGGKVGIGASNFFTFRYDAFVHFPFYDENNDGHGRHYFWNVVLKTSLFNKWPLQHPQIAQVISILLLPLLVYALFPSWAFYRPEQSAMVLVQFFLFLTPVVALMYLRYRIPIPASADFRYIYPVLAQLVALYGFQLSLCLKKVAYLPYVAGLLLGGGLALISFIFNLAQLV